MKKIFFTLATTLVMAALSAAAFAQDDAPENIKPAIPKWVSKTGYWVAEGNLHTPLHHIVYFYNNDNVLVYKETMDNIALKLNKRRTKMRLKKLTDQIVATYAQQQKAAENEMLVLNVMRK